MPPPGVRRAGCTTGWVGDPRETWLLADDGRDRRAGTCSSCRPGTTGTSGSWTSRCARNGGGTGSAPPCCGTPPGGRSRTGAGLLTGYALRRHRGRGLRPVGRGDRRADGDPAGDGHRCHFSRTAGRAAGRNAERPRPGIRWSARTAPTPEECLDQVAAINRALLRRTARSEPSRNWCWDAARVRATDRRMRLQGVRAYSVAALHDATGEMGRLHRVDRRSREAPSWGFQELTAVTRSHRGHRLGLLVKTAMMELLAETGAAAPVVRHDRATRPPTTT